MNLFPKKLSEKLQLRQNENALRSLPNYHFSIDFFSNDYLGFSRNEMLFEKTNAFLQQNNWRSNGATGSRLISGNHEVFGMTEKFIARFHGVPSALIFNSGFDANVGFLSAVPQRNDLILFDALCHASIREGIKISDAKAYKFQHNDVQHLSDLLEKHRQFYDECYIITESVFSMDGDCCPLQELTSLATKTNSKLVVDEAHGLGIFGENGEGLTQSLGLSDQVFARIVTFGKALGCSGAAVLGSEVLKLFLLNFARSFVYTTALSPHSVASIYMHYQHLQENKTEVQELQQVIAMYQNFAKEFLPIFSSHPTAIQTLTFQNFETTSQVAKSLQNLEIGAKMILSPTVPKGEERIRICLHAFNTKAELVKLFDAMRPFV